MQISAYHDRSELRRVFGLSGFASSGIDEEDVMTPRTLSISSAALAVGIAAVSVISFGALRAVPALPQQPRDPRPNQARPATAAEQQLEANVRSTPQDWRAAQELARLQERRGALAEAEATLRRSAEASPSESARWQALAALFNRAGQFERAVGTLESAAERDPSNAPLHHLIATFYFAKLSDSAVGRNAHVSYIARGLAAEERALAADPDFPDAIVYKSLLLRAQAENELNAVRRAALIQQADDVRSRAATSGRSASATSSEWESVTAYPTPPPPPPVPGAADIEWVYGETSFAAANGMNTPQKVKDVRPVYPPMVMQLGIQGRVVVEAAIDARGEVVATRVVESIPWLTQPTIHAVRQWRFDPATIPSAATPVVIRAEARFFPKR
jgi:TonB family protein